VTTAWRTFALIAKSAELRVLVVLTVLLGLGYSFVVPFMSLFGTREVRMSHFGFGVFMTVTALAGIIMSTILAKKSDTRFSRRRVLLTGGLTGMLGYLGYAFLRDPVALTVIGAFFLGASSITFSQVFAYARELLEKSSIEKVEIPLYMNAIRLCFALSWTFGPAVAAWVMTTYSFVGVFLAASFLFALFSLVVYTLVPETPPSEASRLAAEAMPLALALRSPRLFGFFLAFVFYFSCSTMGMMNLPLLITGELAGRNADVGYAYAIAPVFELPFMMYAGLLATRTRHTNLIVGSLVLAALYYCALAVATKVPLVFGLQILSAAVVAIMSGIAITFFQGFLPNQAGTATNLYASATRFGSIFGYLTFGTLAESFGHRAVFGVCALLTAVSAILAGLAARQEAGGLKSSPST
jgi:SET family sugar efflux transporter-like MFS transporter